MWMKNRIEKVAIVATRKVWEAVRMVQPLFTIQKIVVDISVYKVYICIYTVNIQMGWEMSLCWN